MSRETDIEVSSRWSTRAELDQLIAALEKRMPEILACDECDVADAFAGEAEVIADRAGPDDEEYVHDRLIELADIAGVYGPSAANSGPDMSQSRDPTN